MSMKPRSSIQMAAAKVVSILALVLVLSVSVVSQPSNPPARWGFITGTLSNQTDLQAALDGKAAAGVNSDITSLTALAAGASLNFGNNDWFGTTSGDPAIASNNVIGFRMKSSGYVGIGNNLNPATPLEVRGTSGAQQQWSYDANNRAQVVVSSVGNTTFQQSGSGAFVFRGGIGGGNPELRIDPDNGSGYSQIHPNGNRLRLRDDGNGAMLLGVASGSGGIFAEVLLRAPVSGVASLEVIDSAGAGGLQIGLAGNEIAFFGGTPVVQQAALTAADGSTVDGTYGAEEAAALSNAITRIAELEARLEAYGLLDTP